MSERLNSGESLAVGASLASQDARSTFIMQGDGNLVLYRSSGEARWASSTDGHAVSQAIMQSDGNFVIYGSGGEPIWATGTDGHPGASMVVQNDGNVVIYDLAGNALWATDTMIISVRTNFDPRVHGFHFDNNFVNKVMNLPLIGEITTYGRCGGMAFAALDYYFAGMPAPALRSSDFPDRGVPPDGHPLADHLMSRLYDTFLLNGSKFVTWTQAEDHQTWLRGPGVIRLTKLEEIPKLRQSLDSGVPVALGLVRAGPNDTLLTRIGENHQVVAYGYDLDGDTMRICLYDNNYHDQEMVLSTNITDLGSYSSSWRGFFVEEYISVPPWVSTPSVPSPSLWSEMDAGELRTQDSADLIRYNIERGVLVNDPPVVVFKLHIGETSTGWRKNINMPDGLGSNWDIGVDGKGAEAENSLWADQVRNGQVLTFSKAKFLGVMTSVLQLGDLSGLRPNDRVTFSWITD
jgi:hypothetical protein